MPSKRAVQIVSTQKHAEAASNANRQTKPARKQRTARSSRNRTIVARNEKNVETSVPGEGQNLRSAIVAAMTSLPLSRSAVIPAAEPDSSSATAQGLGRKTSPGRKRRWKPNRALND